jgi:hypothetical protein
MMTAINYGEGEGRTMKSDGVETLVGVVPYPMWLMDGI